MDERAQAETARIEGLFTRGDGGFRFARWGRPLVPAVTGTDEAGETIVTDALTVVAGLADVAVEGIDPELGANFLVFFCADWSELPLIPGVPRLVPDIEKLVSVLKGAGANQYRIFDFDERGAIRLCLVLLRYDEDLQKVSAHTLALSQAVQSMLLWSDNAFTRESPLAVVEPTGRVIVKPWFADLLRVAYDPTMPDAATDPALALRLQARLTVLRSTNGDDAP